MDKNPVVVLWFCTFSSCLKVAFLSTAYKAHVSLTYDKKFLETWQYSLLFVVQGEAKK